MGRIRIAALLGLAIASFANAVSNAQTKPVDLRYDERFALLLPAPNGAGAQTIVLEEAVLPGFAEFGQKGAIPGSPSYDDRFLSSSSRPKAGPALSLKTDDRPPAGFEEFVQPQTMFIDLRFDGANKGQVMVIATPDSVRFAEPLSVLKLIEASVKDAPRVAKLLSGEFPHNAKLVCTPQRRPPACGELSPSDIGVIFDLSHLRLDLFLNPELRVTRNPSADYLNAGQPEPSMLIAYGGSGSLATPATSSPARYSAFLQGSGQLDGLSYSSQLLSQNTRGLALNTATMGHDVDDWTFTAGMFNDDTVSPLTAGRLLGASAETSFNLRANPGALYGTPIVLFLTRPAQVDLLRGGRLLSSRRLEAGSQMLDTSDLPDGAYDLTIRITDSSGVPREEHRFFVKSRDFAPAGEPYFHFDIGQRLPYDATVHVASSGAFVVHGAAKIRTFDWLSVGGDAFSYGDTVYGGPAIVAVFDQLRLGANALTSSRNDRALNAYAIGNVDPIFLHVNFVGAYPGLRSIPARISDPLDPVGAGFKQATIGIDYMTADLQFGLSGSYRSGSGISQSSFSPYVRMPIVQAGETNITLDLEATRTGRQTLALLQLSIFRRPPNSHVTYSGNAGYRFGNQHGAPDAAAEVDWENPDEIGQDVRLQGRLQRSYDDDIAYVQADYRGPEGRAMSYFQGTDPQTGALSGVGGIELHGTLTVDDGGIAMGGVDTQTSAVVVQIEGGTPGIRFSVLVNGNPQGYAIGGGSTPVPLAPYRSYIISIRPPTEELLALTARSEEVTLLPGIVKRLAWNVEAVKVVIAQIVDAAGAPIENMRVEGGSDPAATSEGGWVQLEAKSEAVLTLTDRSGKKLCQIRLPDLEEWKMVANLGRLTCGR